MQYGLQDNSGVHMFQCRIEVHWQRGGHAFIDKRYSRKHELRFDGGITVAGSSSPHVVPLPMSDAAAIDPEEGFIASLSSCHQMHHEAHEECFIANSVKCVARCEPRYIEYEPPAR